MSALRACPCSPMLGIALAAPTPKHRGGRAIAPVGRSLGDADASRRAALLCRARMMAFAAAGRAAAAAQCSTHCRTPTRATPRYRFPSKRWRLRSAKRCSPSSAVTMRGASNGDAGASHLHRCGGSLRPVRSHPSHIHRGGVAHTERALGPHAGGGASGTEASEPAQSACNNVG